MRTQTSQKAELFARTLRTNILGVFAVFVFAFTLLILTPGAASAVTSSAINFQARLETSSGSIAPDGNYNVEFKLYDAASSGTLLWSEDHTYNSGTGSSDARLRVVNGYLTVSLGSITAFPGTINWNQQLWLTMNIGGTNSSSVSWDGEMNPRLQLTAVPYAFQAGALGNGSYSAVFNSSGKLEFQQASTIDALSAATGTTLTIQGGTATSGTNVGGNLILQGGAGASTGASGSVIVKSNTNNSTTAFQVQNAIGAAVLTADTVDKFVGIGTTSTPRTTLDVVSSDTNYGGAIIENTDTANSTNSFAPLFVQHDSSTNGSSAGISFRLKNSSGTALTYGYIGGTIQSNVAGSEAGQLIFQAANGSGALSPTMILNSTGVGISQGINFNPQYVLQMVGNTDGNAVGPLVVQSTNSSGSIGTALTLDSSPATGGHKWSFLSTGPAAAVGAGSFSFFDGTANAYRLTIGTTGNVGVGITAPTNLFQVGPFDASGNATRTNGSTTLVGTGTGWTSAQVGDIIVFNGGTTNTVVSVTDSTHLTMGTTYAGTTDGSPVAFTMYKPFFNVTSSGSVYAQSTSTTAFKVQDASGASLLTSDTTNKTVTIRSGNDFRTTGSELYSGNFSSGWTTTGWNVSGVTTAIHNTGNTSSLINTNVSITAGATYVVSFSLGGTCSSVSQTVTVKIGGTTADVFDGTNCDGSTQTVIATAGSTAGLTFTPTSGWSNTISNISIEQLTGIINPVLVVQNASGTANLEVRASSDTSNLFIGLSSGSNNSSGSENTSLGAYTLQSNVGGYWNTAAGAFALQYNTSGYANSAFGDDALESNTTGYNNSAFGLLALASNTSGFNNEAFGYDTLSNNTTGYGNAALGDFGLGFNSTGYNNSALGSSALCNNRTGSLNAAVGFYAGCNDSGGNFLTLSALQNAAAIGAYAQVQASNSIVLGSVDTATKVGIGITVPSNTFSVSPLEYQSGTVTRTNGSATLVGTGTTWASSMVGDIIVFADGTTNTVLGFTDTTHITMGATYTGTTDASPVAYRFHEPGFQVTNTGSAYVQNTSTTAFRVQNASGTNLFTADTSNNALVVGNDGTPTTTTIRGGAATGNNTQGGSITFDASNGTGAAGSGDLIFRTAAGAGLITQDATSKSNNAGSTTTLSWNHTVASQNNRILIVGLVADNTATWTSVKWDQSGTNQSLTRLGSQATCGGVSPAFAFRCHVDLWYVLNPTTGTHTITATSNVAQNSSGGAVSYYNVDQTTPFGSSNSAVGTTTGTQSVSASVSTANANQVVVGIIGANNTTTNGSGAQLWNDSFAFFSMGASKQGTGGSVSLDWSVGNGDWAIILAPLNPASNSTADSLQDRLHITAAGKVGIGTASPQYTLDVAGTQRVATTSTTAFQIQTGAGATVLVADTQNNKITLGSGSGTAATLLVLGSKSDAGDPACTSGGLYYNANANQFRGCRNGTWYNLIAGVDVQDFTASGTWTMPSGVSAVMVLTCGGGGAGGGGVGAAAGGARQGGTGGGGGAYVEKILSAANLSASVSVTVGAQVTGANGGTSASGSNGSSGNSSSFGTYVTAAGGGGGAGGPSTTPANRSGGAGGGAAQPGGAGGAANSAGGDSLSAVTTGGLGWSGGAGIAGGNGTPGEMGGGAGGGTQSTLTTGSQGGSSVFGGGGGGGGGSVTAATPGTANSGSSGGGIGNYSTGGGGTSGSPGAGGAAGSSAHCGAGGGGGNSNNAATGGAGGAGGIPGGGGGGGGGGTSTGGAGGNGARGEVWVISW